MINARERALHYWRQAVTGLAKRTERRRLRFLPRPDLSGGPITSQVLRKVSREEWLQLDVDRILRLQRRFIEGLREMETEVQEAARTVVSNVPATTLSLQVLGRKSEPGWFTVKNLRTGTVASKRISADNLLDLFRLIAHPGDWERLESQLYSAFVEPIDIVHLRLATEVDHKVPVFPQDDTTFPLVTVELSLPALREPDEAPPDVPETRI